MNSVFSEQILADKLAKLNSTQQCIETLSHWCIFHQSKAEQVVQTWDKQFHKSQMAQKVPLLYLANDILQNSKRKGNEFVSEFWKVLPAAIKDVNENGDDRGKSVVSRLVSIWEERRVFGSRVKSLKEVMLGGEAPQPLELSRKRSRSVKITKRDSRSIRTKLSIGGAAEKIVSAFHLVQSEHLSEDAEMSKSMSAVQRVRKMEKDVDVACADEKDPKSAKRQALAKDLEEEEKLLNQSIEKLKSVEATRVTLVFHLKEALHEQEAELENVRTQMQVAQAQAEEACNMRKRLNGEEYVSRPSTATTLANANANPTQTPKRTAASIAAEVADKLAASSSSQMIITSVLSTFAAEEAKNASLKKTSPSSNSLTSMPVSSVNGSASNSANSMVVSDPSVLAQTPQHAVSTNHSYQSMVVPPQTMQSQISNAQAQYHMFPNGPHQQYIQPSGGVMTQYGYGNIAPMPAGPPPPPPNMVNPMGPMTPQHLQMTQHPSVPLTPHPPAPPSFRPLQPPGMAYYNHPHQTQ